MKTPRPVDGSASIWLPIAGVLLAIGLGAYASLYVIAVWSRLPALQAARLTTEDVTRAYLGSRARMSEAVRTAQALANIAGLLNRTLRDPSALAESRKQANLFAADVRGTQVARLQLAMFALLEARQDGLSPEKQWSRLEPFFEGIETASFAHEIPAQLEHGADLYRSLRLKPGTALRLSIESAGHSHGAWLQRFIEEISEITQALRAAGDDSAATRSDWVCRRLLQQWVTAPGPAGLRLLAADLLARGLERDAARNPAAEQIAADLRAWYVLVRDDLRSRPPPLHVLSPGGEREPDPCPMVHDRLVLRLAATTWIAPPMLLAAILSLCCAWWWIPARKRPRRRGLFGGLLAGAAVTGVVPMLAVFFDLRKDFLHTASGGVPIHVIASSIAGLFLCTVLGLWQGRGERRGWLIGVGGTAAGVWTVLAIALLVSGWRAGLQLNAYEACIDANIRRSWSEPVLNDANRTESVRLLQSVRDLAGMR